MTKVGQFSMIIYKIFVNLPEINQPIFLIRIQYLIWHKIAQ